MRLFKNGSAFFRLPETIPVIASRDLSRRGNPLTTENRFNGFRQPENHFSVKIPPKF